MGADDQLDEVPTPTEPDPVAAAAVPPPPPKRRGSVRVRKIAVAVLVVITTLAFTASILAVWSYRQVLNTSVFTDRIESIISDPEVIDALAGYITDEIFDALDAEQLAANALPEQAQVLVGPLTAAIREFVQNTTERVLATEPLQDALIRAIEVAHRNAIKLVEGDTVAGFEIQGDQVVLNTLPVIQEVLQRIGQAGIFGRTVDIPPLTDASGQPSEQIQALTERLGIELPADFGQLTVLQSDSLEEAQQSLKLVRRGLIVLLIGTLLLFVVTLLLSTNRWRTVAQLGIGMAIGMIVVRFVIRQVNEQILDLVKNPENLPAVRAIDSSFFSTLDSLTWLLIASGLVIAVIGFFLGRSDTAARLRATTATQAVRAGRSVTGAGNPVTAFVVGHPDACRLIAVGIGVALLLWSGFSTSGIVVALIVTAVLLLIVELLVRRAGQAVASESDAGSPDDGPGSQPPGTLVSAAPLAPSVPLSPPAAPVTDPGSTPPG